MPFHVKYSWNQQSSKLGGWSMNFWNGSIDLTQATAQAAALLIPINNVTGVQVTCSAYALTTVVPPRLTQNVTTSGGVGGAVTATNDADYPSTALYLVNTSSVGQRTGQWIRGIPDQNVSNSGRYTPTGAYVNKMKALFMELSSASNSWSLRKLDQSQDKKVITALVLATGVVTCPAHGFGAPGSTTKVRITGFATPSSANKIWRISIIDANSFQLSFWQQPTDTTVTGNNPTARVQAYVYFPIKTSEIIRATSHYTGKPTGLLGGRRRRRKKV